MKLPWKSIFEVAKAIYKAFLKGKVVNLPGGIGPVTLPSQGQTPYPAGQSPLDMLPHRPGPIGLPTMRPLYASNPLPEGMELPRDERRAGPRPRRADGLPEPVPPGPPLAVMTLGVVLFVVFGLPIVGLTMLGVLEWRTLADETPGNHITATMRAAFKRAPGAVFLTTLVWCCFLVAVVVGLATHFWFT
jgi:hypothetical protein